MTDTIQNALTYESSAACCSNQSHDLVVGLLHGEHRARPRLRHACGRPVQHVVELGIGRGRVRDEVSLVDLALPREEGSQHGNADAASEIASEVADAGDLVALLGRNADVTQDADGNEDEGETRHLVHTPRA